MIVKPGYAGITFELPDDTIIADIGFGHDPCPYATYYIDRDLGVSADRGGRTAAIVPANKFIAADVEHGIPLSNRSCDFVIASHILEHMNDPDQFCRELVRVGKSGYIETPGIVQELANMKSVHKWFATKIGNRLVVIKKPDFLKDVDYTIPPWFPVRIVLYLFRQTCYAWNGKISLLVVGEYP